MRPLALARIAITQAITKDFEFSQNLNFHSVKISLFSYYISFIHRLSLVFFFPYFWFSFHHLLLPPIVWFHFPHAKVKLFWPEMIPYSPIDGFGLWLYWFVLIEKYVVITKWCNFFLEIFYEEKYEREMQFWILDRVDKKRGFPRRVPIHSVKKKCSLLVILVYMMNFLCLHFCC